MSVPRARVRALGSGAAERPDGDHVLYWMVATRRLEWSFALDRAVAWARALRKPLVVLEVLHVDEPWASDRHHAFALGGMREHRLRLAKGPVAYHPYVEPSPGTAEELVAALARRACLVVTDDHPLPYLRRRIEALATRVAVRVEAIDSCGLLPLSEADRVFTSAHHFRRHLQKRLGSHLDELPSADPLVGLDLPRGRVPDPVSSTWPAADEALLGLAPDRLARLPIDHAVPRSPFEGGAAAARRRLSEFLEHGLPVYAERRNDPDARASSGLSPWLRFGHVSAHEVFHAIASREGWSPARLGARALGQRSGWWGMSEGAEAFLDQLVTWRELGYAFSHVVPDHDRYETLPRWARETLESHAADERPWSYTVDELARAETHDEVWNAAQRQLVGEGVIHNYLRMLWGKKILEWTRSPREAFAAMVELNERYAIDGRDPNTYSGIGWVMGRFDRGWPEREVYGTVRSMSSAAARRKVALTGYLRRWSG